MAAPVEILSQLQRAGVRLRAAGDLLIAESNAPLTDSTRALIRENKLALLRQLSRAVSRFWLIHYSDGRSSASWVGEPTEASWIIGAHAGATRAEPLTETQFLALLDRTQAPH